MVEAPISFRKMSAADFPVVLANEREAYPHPWSENNFRTSFDGRDEIWLLCLGVQAIGHGVLSMVADEAHLLNLCVAHKHQGHGYGRRLLEFLVQRARELEGQTMFLEVRISNDKAICLYGAQGFCEVGLRKNYYPASGKKGEHALVMALALCE